MKYLPLGKITAGVLTALLVMVLAGGAAFAGSGSDSGEVRKRANLELTPTEVFRDVEGDADLRLFIRGEGNTEFRASAIALGEGIIDDAFYSLCVDHLFIDADRARELVLDPDEARADLAAELEPSPFSALLGLKVTINLGIGCDGTEVLHGVVTELN